MRIFFFLMVVCFSLSFYANSENIEKSKNKLKVDSLIFFDVNKDSIIWYEPFQKNQYVYYDNGNLKEFYLSKYREGKWDKKDKEYFKYDKNNNIIKRNYYKWNAYSYDWDLIGLSNMKYDIFNQIVEELVSTYRDDTLCSKFKTLFKYDKNSNIIQKAKYEKIDSIWILEELIESIYEDNRLITENYTNVYDDLKYYINDTNGYTFYWKLDTTYYTNKYKYKINENDQIIERTYFYGYTSETSAPTYKETFSYAGNNKKTEISYNYKKDINKFQFREKYTYDYDENDSLIRKISYYWDDKNQNWLPNDREIYKYDRFGNYIERYSDRYNKYDSTFKDSKYLYLIKMDTTEFLKDIIYPKNIFFYFTNKMQNIPLLDYQLEWSYETERYEETVNRIRYYYSKVK